MTDPGDHSGSVNESGNTMVLGWDQLEGVAQEAFDVWESGAEVEWAKQTWERAVYAGLANYSNEVERHQLVILFLGLAGFYRDFCSKAWQEDDPPMYSYWAEPLDIDKFILGQLVGPDPTLEEDDALNYLVNAARPRIFMLLKQIFEGVDLLFVSLWRTVSFASDEGEDDSNEALTNEAILNSVTVDKQVAYEWLRNGADIVLDPI